jgi:hypothetical protein
MPGQAHLRLVHQPRAQNGDIGLKARQHGLADAETLNGLLIRAGKQVLIACFGKTEHLTQHDWEYKFHWEQSLFALKIRAL